MKDFLELLDALDPDAFDSDPRPGWAGPDTLFGAPLRRDPPFVADYVAAGIPFDATASSRPGAAEGSRAIRVASLAFSSYLSSLGSHEMLDTRTGATFRYRAPSILDAGDLHVFPTSTTRTFQAVATEVSRLADSGARLLLLGGDHSVSFPAFAGVLRALRGRVEDERLGYVQIDHHFDFGEESPIHGPIYHGSNARRISELRGMTLERTAFVGVGTATRRAQFEGLRRDGARVVTADSIRREGVVTATGALVEHLRGTCSAIYLSIDIDVLDCSEAPGTGHVTIGGLLASHLLDLVEAFRSLPIVAVDVTEVAPRYDPSGRTAQIAARALFELVCREA